MKAHIPVLIIFVGLFASLLISNETEKLDHLIFPNPGEKICFVKATGKIGGLLVGEKLPADHALVMEIMKQMNFPIHRSMIKLSQCTRNLASKSEGPNVLFLSQTEGGFPRQGLILKTRDRTVNYPGLFYVDLVLDEQKVARGELDIYSHELGHVMMLNIMGDEIPDSRSTKQHVSMGITDYSTAFFEGWGIHFQRLTYDNIPLYQQTHKNSLDYSRGFARAWHSKIDQSLRLNAVLENNYIHQKLLPAVDISALGTEELILLEHTSPVFDKTKLKNAQQMLSCEGVLASLFYRINTNEILQENYLEGSFYNRFLLNPIPKGTKPEEIFTPMENVFLKNFYVWDKIKERLTPESTIFIEFIKQWCDSFPEDKQEIIKLFIMMTVGKTVTDDIGKAYEVMSYHGIIGDYQKFRELATRVLENASGLIKKILAEEISLEENVGPQIWVKNEDFLIRTTLWNPQNKKPLYINLNTASEFDLTSFPNISLEKAKIIIQKREEMGYFTSLEQAKACGLDSCESSLRKYTCLCLFGQQEHEHEQQQTDRDRNRWQWQMPVRVMDEIGVKEGMTVADVGAGDGYFTLYLAERVGINGKVIASDIDDRALQVIRDRCSEKGIQNVSVISAEADDPLIPQKSADIILMVNVIHLIENPSEYLKKLGRSLKPEGRLVIVQWDAEKMDSESTGWDEDDRAKYTLRTNLRHIYDGDFEVVQIKDFLPMQLIYICQPSTHK